MSKLAMVLGSSGAGKSFVAENCKAKSQIITIDRVRKDAIGIMRPGLAGEQVNRWEIWDILLNEPCVYSAIEKGVLNQFETLNISSNILAEGGLLGNSRFREVFLETLTKMGFAFSKIELFFINPEPDAVFANIQTRSKHRLADSKRTLESNIGEITHYREAMKATPCRHFTSSGEALAAVEQFFNS